MQQDPSQPTSTFTPIHPETNIGHVSLRVADLDRSINFYQGVLGFRVVNRNPGHAILGDEAGTPLLELHEIPGAPPQPRRATGLYHVAILLPTRADLGQALVRMAKAGLDIGQADHLVSEALYISDPDGNGLEIYRDRPREEWRWAGGNVAMASDPLDIPAIIEEGRKAEHQWDVLPAGTRVGHIHLQVGDISGARHFYHDILGFDVTAYMPSAIFLSAGGYHHHIGANTWQSHGAPPAPETGAGLHSFVLALPNRQAVDDIRSRLASHNIPTEQDGDALIIEDPWHNRLRLITNS